jgi:hypothetical protein
MFVNQGQLWMHLLAGGMIVARSSQERDYYICRMSDVGLIEWHMHSDEVKWARLSLQLNQPYDHYEPFEDSVYYKWGI